MSSLRCAKLQHETFPGPSSRHHRPVNQKSCRWLSHRAPTASEDEVDVPLDKYDSSPAPESAESYFLDHDDSREAELLEDGQPNSYETHEGDQLGGGEGETQAEYTGGFTIKRSLSDGPTWEDKKLRSQERIRALKESGRWATYQGRIIDQSKRIKYREHMNKSHRLSSGKKHPPHWMELMAILERMSTEVPVIPKGADSETVHREFLVREEVVVSLSAATNGLENIWFVQIRNGCRIRVLDASESEGIYRKMIISGTQRAVELVEKQLREMDEKQVARLDTPPRTERESKSRTEMARSRFPIIPSTTAFEKTGKLPLVRGFFYNNIYFKTYPLASTENPTATTVKQFARLVERVISSPVEKRPTKTDPPHHNNVAKRLREIFTEPEFKPYLSSYALNLALRYLTKFEYLDSVRAILKASHAVATVETYNILMFSTAKRQDFFFLQSLLLDMEKSEIQPDGKTWAYFLDCLLSAEPRRYVIQRMAELGFLNDEDVKYYVIRNNIGLELSPHLQKGGSMESFFEHLAESYGRATITTGMFNAVIGQLRPQRDVPLLKETLECFDKFGVAPDKSTIQFSTLYFRRWDDAVMVLLEYIHRCEQALTEVNYERMFLMAVRSWMPNSCRVIWRYACSAGATTPLMRHTVQTSLLERGKGRTGYPGNFRYHLGAIVVGMEYHQHGINADSEASRMVPPEHKNNALEYMVENIPSTDPQRLQIANQLFKDDVNQGPNWHMTESLSMMLDAAVRMDTEYPWHSRDPNAPSMHRLPTIDILKHLIHVPIESA